MFGLGTWEIALILLVALLFLGPNHLPKLARTLGKAMREMRRATNELRMNIELEDEPRPPPPRPEAAPARAEPASVLGERPPRSVESGGSASADPYAEERGGSTPDEPAEEGDGGGGDRA